MMTYHASLYATDRPVPSYWEAIAPISQARFQPFDRDDTCEVAIIGGGYTGLSAALHLARDHGIDARVLEAGHIGWGASGRNGGMCAVGATKLSFGQMIRRFGAEETKRFYAAQRDAVELVGRLATEERIDFDSCGEGVFEVAHKPERAAELAEAAAIYRDMFGIPARLYSREEFLAIGHDSTEQFGALHIGLGFGLNPMKFLAGLAEAAARRGAKLYGHSRVMRWRREGSFHVLETERGRLRAEKVILAANGFLRDDLHSSFRGRFVPVLSNIIVTRPLTPSELEAQGWRTECPIWNTRQLLFYYRLLSDRRLLFGARGDFTGRPAAAARMKAWLIRRMGQVFPAWQQVDIDYFWRGFICLTGRLCPAAGRLDDDPSVWFGYGYHGGGVASAPWTGKMLASMIAGSNYGQSSLPAAMAGLPPRLYARSLLVRAGYLAFRLLDDR